MQRGCTTAQGAVPEGGALECPVSLGEKLENADFSVFFKARMIFYGRRSLV
jgi:hypothetical protein